MPEFDPDREQRERAEKAATAMRDMQQRYKNVFRTPEGRLVLGDILTVGHFGEMLNPNDTVAIAEHNAAVLIARTAGAFDSLWRELGMVVKEGD
jgi:hypothetical protein